MVKRPAGAQACMYKKMDIGERAAKVAELARQLGILDGLLDGPHAVADAAGPTTADAALFPTLVFCKEARRYCIAVCGWQAAATRGSDELPPVLCCEQAHASPLCSRTGQGMHHLQLGSLVGGLAWAGEPYIGFSLRGLLLCGDVTCLTVIVQCLSMLSSVPHVAGGH